MRAARLTAVCIALLAVAPAAYAQRTQAGAPTDLHGFLLRADEARSTSFPRTPAFAWNPVPSALSYQFQLAMSTPARENAIVYSAKGLKTPVAAPTVTLPWITSMLHARVRAILSNGITPWSAPFNFDMTPPPPPTPLSSYPGLLRWTPVEGADGYQIELLNSGSPGKAEVSFTNVLDEREFYTFHRTPSWVGTILWRIRALRNDNNPDQRKNGIPAVGYGPWSGIYSSSNPTFQDGPITLIGTISDVFTGAIDGAAPAHELMPAFLFGGDQTVDGSTAELFQVQVFTDRQCLNRVYAGAVVGSPAYAPRPYGMRNTVGTLSLPTTLDGLIAARTSILPDGPAADPLTPDGGAATPNEALAPAAPTVAVPDDSDTDPGGSSATAAAAPAQLKVSGQLGAPIDLWDTQDQASGGYWWTVVGVEALAPDALSTNVTSATTAGATTIPVADGIGFAAGDLISVGYPADQESATVVSVTNKSISVASPLKQGHGASEPIVRSSGNLQYVETESPQDVCAAGRVDRVARFAINSEPVLGAGSEPFATGLSSRGRLISARRSNSFYGNPLVAWTPAFEASAYEVQWSKTAYPFTPEPDPANAGAPGTMTSGTAAVLPLSPGTWYYRVRGFNYSLPTGAQQMAWSDPARIVVAKPQFKVVGGGH